MTHSLLLEKSSLDAAAIFRAERQYHESRAKAGNLFKTPEEMEKLTAVEKQVTELRQEVKKLDEKLSLVLAKLEQVSVSSGDKKAPAPAASKPAPAAAKAPAKADDDMDLFGSDEEDEESKNAREAIAKAHLEKKGKKPAVIAKSMIILDVKPWDDETDVKEMEKSVRSIEMDGLLWGTSKFVEIAYGIKKLQITCVVEDDKVSVDTLEEAITGFEELVQSIDIVAFNKI